MVHSSLVALDTFRNVTEKICHFLLLSPEADAAHQSVKSGAFASRIESKEDASAQGSS